MRFHAEQALVALVLLVGVLLSGVCPSSSSSTSSTSSSSPRHKRYLHFPYGSTLRVAFSSKWSTIFDWPKRPAFWTQNVNWGLTYDLPNGTQLLGPAGFGGFASRRDRRDLYRRLETAIDSTGFFGKPCLLRAICEAPQALAPGDNVFAEILRVILRYPRDEEGPTGAYDLAHISGYKGNDCARLYPDCPVSVLGLVLSLRPA